MADKKQKTFKRKMFEAGSWKLARRIGKSIPYIGTAMAIGMVGYDIKKKGTMNGLLNSGLDAIPFVGLAKNAVEFFAGDIFPDKQPGPGYAENNGNRGTNTNDREI